MNYKIKKASDDLFFEMLLKKRNETKKHEIKFELLKNKYNGLY